MIIYTPDKFTFKHVVTNLRRGERSNDTVREQLPGCQKPLASAEGACKKTQDGKHQ